MLVIQLKEIKVEKWYFLEFHSPTKKTPTQTFVEGTDILWFQIDFLRTPLRRKLQINANFFFKYFFILQMMLEVNFPFL